MTDKIVGSEILPGREFSGLSSYGLKEHFSKCGLGENMLRTKHLAQPRALRVGDILATGDEVLSLPREGGNGMVWIHLEGGVNGHWVDVPARIPIALRFS